MGWYGIICTEVGVKSPGNAKTLRITLYAQNLGRFPKVGLGLVPGLLRFLRVEPPITTGCRSSAIYPFYSFSLHLSDF